MITIRRVAKFIAIQLLLVILCSCAALSPILNTSTPSLTTSPTETLTPSPTPTFTPTPQPTFTTTPTSTPSPTSTPTTTSLAYGDRACEANPLNRCFTLGIENESFLVLLDGKNAYKMPVVGVDAFSFELDNTLYFFQDISEVEIVQSTEPSAPLFLENPKKDQIKIVEYYFRVDNWSSSDSYLIYKGESTPVPYNEGIEANPETMVKSCQTRIPSAVFSFSCGGNSTTELEKDYFYRFFLNPFNPCYMNKNVSTNLVLKSNLDNAEISALVNDGYYFARLKVDSPGKIVDFWISDVYSCLLGQVPEEQSCKGKVFVHYSWSGVSENCGQNNDGRCPEFNCAINNYHFRIGVFAPKEMKLSMSVYAINMQVK